MAFIVRAVGHSLDSCGDEGRMQVGRAPPAPEGHGEQPGQGSGSCKTRDHSPCTAAALPSLHPCIFTSSVSKQ